jgi:acetate kinase
LFAPDHNRLQLMGIDTATDLLGNAIPQFAVFDTAFHATLPPSAYVYPGPYEWHAQGIRRYGFHGISHQYCASRCAALIGSPVEALRMVTCHLGNGCSLAAIRAGACVDTTMGFTPMEGLMMGTRSGSVDPGILLHLLKSGQCTAEELERILSRESGIKGIAGGTGDMRDLLVRIQRGEARAQLAFDIFVHRVRSGIAAMAASAGGLDVLVFTGGIGEHAAPVRAAVCAGLEFLGVRLGELNHRAGDSDIPISAPDTAVQVFVVQAREEWQIAKECRRLASTSEPQ